ncbi:right-handed parallel beta-helix repeat-containing protein [Portibacter marinus]|uniref:right-handed parallel beta-helix repeat-containing protein n=1 Tax=Portibacter marinus TaxID=2898660 RepID=UPI001F2A13B9|nr:right-handed parallel beta-helix repeat-containing protein [Portibacter marinus]
MYACAAVQIAAGMGSGKTYSGTQTIDDDYIGGDLYIDHGANITINGTVELADNAEIEFAPTSKLTLNGTLLMGESVDVLVRRGSQFIIDGGTITTAPCANEWSGIFVDGYSNQSQTMPGFQIGYATNGVVEVKNNSLIENAWTAFSTNSRGIGWPQEQDYRGGLILVENSTIQNCFRAAEFVDYDIENKSEFVNVTFDGQDENATHWETVGVEYNNCDFLNYSTSAISTLDAGVDVYSSNFDGSYINSSAEASIIIEHTFSGNKVSDIDGNIFDDGYQKLMLSPGNTSPITIANNVFEGGDRYGVYVVGDGWFTIEDNSFRDLTYEGIYLSSTGNNSNLSKFNKFYDCEFGIYAFYDNSGFEFEQKCFTGSSSKDVGYSGNTYAVGPSPGILGEHDGTTTEAGNSFTTRFKAIGRYGTTDVFNYHIKTGTSTSSTKVPYN